MRNVGVSAKKASAKIAAATSDQKNIFLEKLAEILIDHNDDIIEINKKDVDYDIFIEEITNLNFLTFENETYKIIKKQQKVKKKKKIFK